MKKVYVLLVAENCDCNQWCIDSLGSGADLICCQALDVASVLTCNSVDYVVLDSRSYEPLELMFMFLTVHEDLGYPTYILTGEQFPLLLLDYFSEIDRKLFIQVFSDPGSEFLRNLVSCVTDIPAEEPAILPSSFDYSPPVLLDSETEMEEFQRKIMFACQSLESVLLTGESGSGKGYYANYIHVNSSRRNNCFIIQNMAELSPTLVEGHLFGTEAHAYTGAVKTSGLFAEANGGTLFMDEIGELPVFLQPKLLSVLENRKYKSLGSQKNCSIDVRFIFATNRNLQQEMKIGNFRKDLYYRINSLEIEVPPLRRHKEDIGPLAELFCSCRNKKLSSDAIKKLQEYHWPGNIRQLQTVIARACSYSSQSIVECDNIIL